MLSEIIKTNKNISVMEVVSLKWFKNTDFDSKDLPNSWVNMDFEFMRLIDELRSRVGLPIIINSAFRTRSHNLKVEGKSNSSHTRGLAVDLRISSSSHRFLIIKYALELGITRIGVYETFIHLDIDKSLPEGVIWYE